MMSSLPVAEIERRIDSDQGKIRYIEIDHIVIIEKNLVHDARKVPHHHDEEENQALPLDRFRFP